MEVCAAFNVLIPLTVLRYPRVERFRVKAARFAVAVLIPARVLLVAIRSRLYIVLNELNVLRFIGISVNMAVELGYAATCANKPRLYATLSLFDLYSYGAKLPMPPTELFLLRVFTV